jgi:hypothetical protein
MPGLKDDETRIENLYKDYKRFVKINPFSLTLPARTGGIHERPPFKSAGN